MKILKLRSHLSRAFLEMDMSHKTMEERCTLRNVVTEAYLYQIFKVKLTQIDKVQVCLFTEHLARS